MVRIRPNTSLSQVHMVLDAARAAHIAGVGAHGSGFLNDPQDVLRKVTEAQVNLIAARHLGRGAARNVTSMSNGSMTNRERFPSSLPRISLTPAKLGVFITESGYSVTLDGMLKELSKYGFANTGEPIARLL